MATSRAVRIVSFLVLPALVGCEPPLPFPDPEGLVVLEEEREGAPELTQASFQELSARTASFESLAAVYSATTQMGEGPDSVPIAVAAASVDLFLVLGAQPLLGRLFTVEDDRPDSRRTAILSFELWQERLGGRPELLGSDLTLDGRAHTIVGVMPAGFDTPGGHGDLWVPLGTRPPEPGDHVLSLTGRLRAGVEVEQATTELAAVVDRLAARDPERFCSHRLRVVPLRERWQAAP